MSDVKKFPVLYKKSANEGTQVWEIWVTKESRERGCIHVQFGLKGGKLQLSKEPIVAGKNIGKKNETTAYEQACSEAESRWEVKRTRKGYTTEEAESGLVRAISPMLALPYDKQSKKVDWATAFTQPKLDGFRLLAKFGKDGKVSLTSRENLPLEALTHIKSTIEALKTTIYGKVDTLVLDGEAYCHGMSLNEISSACKKKTDKTKNIKFNIYDCLMGDANFMTRNLFVKDMVQAAESDHVLAVETIKVRSEAELMHCQGTFIEAGYEGAMLRHSNAPYEAGKRSSTLLKVKTFVDDEFEVIDFKMARGKYAGCPIYVCRTTDGNPFDVLAHGTIEEKKAQGANARSFIGKMLTVKYFNYTKTSEPVPFFPVAKGFRSKR